MKLVVAVALGLGCRGDRPHDAGSNGSASVVSAADLVPKLPATPEGPAELRVLDDEVERARTGPHREPHVELLLERAAIRGRLEDYVEANDASEALVRTSPVSVSAWTVRCRTLTRIHRFA